MSADPASLGHSSGLCKDPKPLTRGWWTYKASNKERQNMSESRETK